MGRPSKGERVAVNAKPDTVLAGIIRRNAVMLDMSAGDYVVALVAYALDMPDHAPQPGRSTEALEALELIGERPMLPSTVVPLSAASRNFTHSEELTDQIAS